MQGCRRDWLSFVGPTLKQRVQLGNFTKFPPALSIHNKFERRIDFLGRRVYPYKLVGCITPYKLHPFNYKLISTITEPYSRGPGLWEMKASPSYASPWWPKAPSPPFSSCLGTSLTLSELASTWPLCALVDNVSTFHTQIRKCRFLRIHCKLCIAFDLDTSPGTKKHPENQLLRIKEGAVPTVVVFPTYFLRCWPIEMLSTPHLLLAVRFFSLEK